MEFALMSHWNIQKKEKKAKALKTDSRHKSKVSAEDQEILTVLNETAYELKLAQKNFDLVDNDMLIDSFSYEIMALNKRYDYYITLCKERGLAAVGIVKRGG